ncbi:MAG: Na+/H+ antiporter NhaC family protein [Peptostreptococcaceae bacterium]
MNNTQNIKKCRISKSNIYLILSLCIIPIIVCVALNITLVYAFTIGVFFSTIISLKSGYSKQEVKAMILKSVLDCKELYFVILLIGATVSALLVSGVVPSLIYYGLEKLGNMNFLFAAFILIAATSVFMGTAVGTISTIGIAVLGLGKGFGIPTPVLVGVIVSGSFLADKVSPISGLLNLNLATTETNYKKALKSYKHTLIPTIIICSVIYFYMGSKIPMSNQSVESIEIIYTINNNFVVSPYLLLLPILTVVLSFMGVKSIYCMLTGVVAGSFIGVFLQKVSAVDLFKYLLFGHSGSTDSQMVNEILTGGGVLPMLSVVLIVIGALAISSILQETGIINYLTKGIVGSIKTKKDLIWKTSFISSLLTILTCDQAAGIVIPSQLFKEKYKELGVENSILSRTISDTGVIIAPIIPWNVNALIVSLVTGVSCVSYAPFAILCFVTPIVTIVISWFKGDR